MSLQETATPLTLQAIIIVLTILDCLAISMRLYTRYAQGQAVKIDDYFALAGFAFVLGLAVYFIIGISDHYVGYPLPDDFTGEEYHPLVSGSLLQFYAWGVLFYPAMWCVKCSFILFYRRVLVAKKGDTKDWANMLLILSLVLITIWTLGFGLAWAFVCTPVRTFWSFPYGESEAAIGTCVDTWKLQRAMSISDFLVDLLILLMPIPLVWRLRMKVERKLAVLVVFFLGVIAVAASIMRMARVIWASSPLGEDADGLIVNTTVIFWGMVELNLAIFAVCLPTIRGLLKTQAMNSLIESYRSRTWLKSSSSRSRSNKSTGDTDGLPLTNSPSHKQSAFSEYKSLP